jgi:dTDP-L-rhamnose 4-epimerase
MSDRVLITLGAGFIGSHLADKLLAAGYGVRVLDNLMPQVHGRGGGRAPANLAREPGGVARIRLDPSSQ